MTTAPATTVVGIRCYQGPDNTRTDAQLTEPVTFTGSTKDNIHVCIVFGSIAAEFEPERQELLVRLTVLSLHDPCEAVLLLDGDEVDRDQTQSGRTYVCVGLVLSGATGHICLSRLQIRITPLSPKLSASTPDLTRIATVDLHTPLYPDESGRRNIA